MTWKGGLAGAPSLAPKSHAKVERSMKLPDGRMTGDLPPAELRAVLRGLGLHVPHDGGFQNLVDIYHDHLQRVGEQAAADAVTAWREQRRE